MSKILNESKKELEEEVIHELALKNGRRIAAIPGGRSLQESEQDLAGGASASLQELAGSGSFQESGGICVTQPEPVLLRYAGKGQEPALYR